jgi:hypothetical protein
LCTPGEDRSSSVSDLVAVPARLPHVELVEELRLRLIGFDQLKQLAELSCTSRRFE